LCPNLDWVRPQKNRSSLPPGPHRLCFDCRTDGGNGEISLGGSRLNRFMNDVANVTGKLGDGEAVTPDEEVNNSVNTDDSVHHGEEKIGAQNGAGETAVAGTNGASPGGHDNGADPWQALAQVGSQLVAALVAGNAADTQTHTWIERDPATGTQSLRVPLPPPETMRRLADVFSALADSLQDRKP